ncbi:hypothetical protein [Microvirga lenta]|uniref:hypothetical protein n=1 Tax=Microvirga lenta TaxID=2881337 RepID=UPI001CFFE598|nr:hypothetical protein [Microvirga lenta]MCB5176159.1 hypothetical protein [Microvirga lenta]
MCYDRRSFASESRKAAGTDQSKQMQTKRTETVDALLRDAKEAPKPSPAEAPAKEAAPAK